MNVHDVMELSWEDLIGIIDLDKDQTENASLDLADILEKWKHKASLGFLFCKGGKMAGGDTTRTNVYRTRAGRVKVQS